MDRTEANGRLTIEVEVEDEDEGNIDIKLKKSVVSNVVR
jgi:hypothetical protein